MCRCEIKLTNYNTQDFKMCINKYKLNDPKLHVYDIYYYIYFGVRYVHLYYFTNK